MNIAEAVIHLYPSADPTNDFRVVEDGNGQRIEFWNVRNEVGELTNIPSQEELEGNWLVICKNTKIAELNRTCNETILGGFISDCLGVDRFYDFDYEAQVNLNGLQNKIQNDLAFVGRGWKTRDAGIFYHTREQLLQLFDDGYAWKDANVAHYWGLKTRVNNAITEEEINGIVW